MISQRQWKEKYGRFVWGQIDLKAYKESLKQLKKHIFNKNNLTTKRDIVIEERKAIDLDLNDPIIKDYLFIIKHNLKNIFYIPKNKEKMFLRAGLVALDLSDNNPLKEYIIQWTPMRRNKYIYRYKHKYIWTMNIANFRKFLNNNGHNLSKYFITASNETIDRQNASRALQLEKLNSKLKETSDYSEAIEFMQQIKAIEKRIEKDKEKMVTYQKALSVTDSYEKIINSNFSYKIELSYDIRKIASQSTNTPWRSCMNLDNGENLHYVATGIAAGTFVAYMRNENTEFARILFKPYVAYDASTKGFIYNWIPSKLYWNSQKLKPNQRRFIENEFAYKIKEFVKGKYRPEKSKDYVLVSKVYNDREAYAVDKYGNCIEDDYETYEDSTNRIIRDYYDIECALRFMPDRIISYLKSNFYDLINQQQTSYYDHMVITDDVFRVFELKDMVNFPKEYAAFREIFELTLGVDFSAYAYYAIVNHAKWHSKIEDVYNLFRSEEVKYTKRYADIIRQRQINADRIMLKYDLSKDEMKKFYLDYFQNWAIFKGWLIAAYKIANKDSKSNEVTIDDVQNIESFKNIEHKNPDIYKRLCRYIESSFLDVSFNQGAWD